MQKWALGAAALALLVWAFVSGGAPDPADQLARAETLLRERFADWRARVEHASARLSRLDAPTRGELFAAAERIVAEERVDGVAIVDWNNRARVWAGRTFDTDPRQDFAGVQAGVERVDILDLPAHRVLFAARPAGGEIAVALLAFDDRFPQGRSLGDEIARECGLATIVLHFGSTTRPTAEPGRQIVIDDLVTATLAPKEQTALEREAAKARTVRLRTLLFAAALLAAVAFWRLARQRLPATNLLRAFLAIVLLAGLRTLLSELGLPAWPTFQIEASVHPLWAGPGDTALTALTALLIAIILARTARVDRPHPLGALLAGAGIAFCLLLPRLYTHLVALVAQREDNVLLFDPLSVWPSAEAALLLVSLCLLTGALFLCVHAAFWWARHCHRLLAPVPYVAVGLGLLPWGGAWLAACAVLVSLSLVRGGPRPERAMAVTILAAIASFPFVYLAQRDVFVRDVAARALDLINRKPRHEAQARLERAAEAMTDPGRGVARRVAQDLAVGRGLRHLAFRLWSAADWDVNEPCAVQVWDRNGLLVSSFDFDSPPSKWLPAGPRTAEAGAHELFGRAGGEALQFYAYDLELRTIGDQRRVGLARIVVPDQWDVLLYSTLRPSLFRAPLDLRVRAPTPPMLLAELDPTGTPRRSSSGTTAELEPPSSELLLRAHRQGHASARVRFRGRDALLILAAARYKCAALVFKEAPFQQGAFVFAKVLLTYTAVCLAYALAVLLLRRGRVTILFRHRVALVLVLLSVPPLLLLAAHNRRVARELHQERVDQRLRRRLDLAETLLRERQKPVDNAWCIALAARHFVDINVYRGQDLIATSRPGLWDTGLLGRRLAARPYATLVLEDRNDYAGREYFGHSDSLRVVFRKVQLSGTNNPSEPILLSAPALEDRSELERKATEGDALLLAIFLTTATITVVLALVLARSLTRPVLQLREATSRIAAGELDARLPEGRADEFGDLIRAFNRMTRELREAQDLRVRAEKARAWQEMARQVAHEIKNPLTPIKLTIQNLLAAYQEDPEGFKEEFENGAKLILDQIAALHRIAGAFSAYAKFPSRHPRQIDVNTIMADVAALYGAAGGSVVDVCPAPSPLVVQADYDELRRALINLVTNSRQARAGRVTLSAAAEDGYARLDVVDDGAGIPPEVQTRLFDPSFTTKTSGTGLGLPIVKRIVDDCGGTIEIESPPDGGTRITIRLPIVS